MKYILLLLTISSCISSREFISSDYSPTARFDEYTTFSFMEMTNMDYEMQQGITKAIHTRLAAQGYHLETKNPDLIIQFHLLQGNYTLTNYEQPTLKVWSSLQASNTSGFTASKNRCKGSTLMISFYDRAEKKVIWRGYQTNLSDASGWQLTAATLTILDNYSRLAPDLQNQLIARN